MKPAEAVRKLVQARMELDDRYRERLLNEVFASKDELNREGTGGGPEILSAQIADQLRDDPEFSVRLKRAPKRANGAWAFTWRIRASDGTVKEQRVLADFTDDGRIYRLRPSPAISLKAPVWRTAIDWLRGNPLVAAAIAGSISYALVRVYLALFTTPLG